MSNHRRLLLLHLKSTLLSSCEPRLGLARLEAALGALRREISEIVDVENHFSVFFKF